MLLYFIAIEKFIITFIYLIPCSAIATTLSSIIISIFFLTCGYLVHLNDLPSYIHWIEYINPTTWTITHLLNRELSMEAIASSFPTMLCRNKQVTNYNFEIA